jgi:hypothetical protein
MKREQIIEVLKSHKELVRITKQGIVRMGLLENSFEEIADAILALPIDVPTYEEAEEAAKHIPMSEPTISRRAFMKCYIWFKNELLLRNK